MRTDQDPSQSEQQKQNYLDSFYAANLSPEFLILSEKARDESRKLNKEGISVSLSEAYLISELIKQNKCTFFVELGSLTGYSALFILRGLQPGGELFCFEKDEYCSQFLTQLFESISNVPELATKKVTVISGDARASLSQWKPQANLNGVFIDANKSSYLYYLDWIESNLSGHFLIVADNVFLGGSVWGQTETVYSKKQIQVMTDFNKRLIANPNYSSFFVGTSEGLLVAKRN